MISWCPAGDSERDLNTEEEEEAKFKSGDTHDPFGKLAAQVHVICLFAMT